MRGRDTVKYALISNIALTEEGGHINRRRRHQLSLCSTAPRGFDNSEKSARRTVGKVACGGINPHLITSWAAKLRFARIRAELRGRATSSVSSSLILDLLLQLLLAENGAHQKLRVYEMTKTPPRVRARLSVRSGGVHAMALRQSSLETFDRCGSQQNASPFQTSALMQRSPSAQRQWSKACTALPFSRPARYTDAAAFGTTAPAYTEGIHDGENFGVRRRATRRRRPPHLAGCFVRAELRAGKKSANRDQGWRRKRRIWQISSTKKKKKPASVWRAFFIRGNVSVCYNKGDEIWLAGEIITCGTILKIGFTFWAKRWL